MSERYEVVKNSNETEKENRRTGRTRVSHRPRWDVVLGCEFVAEYWRKRDAIADATKRNARLDAKGKQ